MSDPGTGVAHPSFRSASRGVRDSGTLHGFRWWPVTPAWWLAPVNVARSRRRQGWLAPVNSAPSPSSPPRRKVQRFRFGVPCRGSCSWPRSRMPAAMVKCNVRPGCTVGADRSMVCTVHHRSCPASGPTPCTAEGPPTDAILTPVRFRRFQGIMRLPCAPCTPAPDTVLLHCRRKRPCTVAPCALRSASGGPQGQEARGGFLRSGGHPDACRPGDAAGCGPMRRRARQRPVRLDGAWRRPVSNSEFELNRECHGGMLSLWSCRSMATCGRRWPEPTTRAARCRSACRRSGAPWGWAATAARAAGG